MKRQFLICMMTLMVTGYAQAEGGCPPGQYPYDTPQARQCVPIPGGGAAAPSQPAAIWEDRYGAIATDPTTGEVGVSSKQASRRKARKEALQQCSVDGAKNCKIKRDFLNQCAAIAWGNGFRGYGFGFNQKAAEQEAVSACANGEHVECEVKWSDCSLPARVQ